MGDDDGSRTSLTVPVLPAIGVTVAQQSEATLRASRYNHFLVLRESGVILGYNALSGLSVEFPISSAETIHRILSSPNDELTDREFGVKLTLTQGGFLISETIDELALIKVHYRQSRFQVTGVGYTVLLTRDCNLRCPYCFQEHQKDVLAPEVADALVEMADRDTRGGKPLSVTWFGGEPLLHLDLLFNLAKRLRAVARKNRSEFGHSFISNGYLLTPAVAEKLAKIGCRSTQITLDGPRRIHDTKRVLRGGAPTFDRIVKNMLAAAGRMSISVRVNIDRNNVDSMEELLDELEAAGLRGKVRIYFARIQPVTQFCSDVAGVCCGAEDFSKWESRFEMRKLERGWGSPRYPALRGPCAADSIVGKTICPDGTIVKCWNDVSSPEKAIGHLLKPTLSEEAMAGNQLHWMSWDPFEKAECVECNILPLCMGGCPSEVFRLKLRNRGDCTSLRYNLKETIGLIYLHTRAVEEMRRREQETGDIA